MVATSYKRQMLGSTAHAMCVGKASYMIPRLHGLYPPDSSLIVGLAVWGWGGGGGNVQVQA